MLACDNRVRVLSELARGGAAHVPDLLEHPGFTIDGKYYTPNKVFRLKRDWNVTGPRLDLTRRFSKFIKRVTDGLPGVSKVIYYYPLQQ